MTQIGEYIDRSLHRIADHEAETLGREIAEVDSQFSLAGRLNSGAWRGELIRTILEGLDRASVEMVEHVRAVVVSNPSLYAEDVRTWVTRLGDHLVGSFREKTFGGGKSGLTPQEIAQECERLAERARSIRDKAIDDLTHKPPRPVVRASTPNVAGNLSVNAHGSVAIAGGDVNQSVEGIDLVGFLSVLSQVRQSIEAARTAQEQQVELIDQVVALEATAQHPTGSANRVWRLARRLGTELKAAGISVATDLLEAYIRKQTGL